MMTSDTQLAGSPPPPAVVLLSGGLDSATTLAIARHKGFACHALSFDYGQRHAIELKAARRVADHLCAASHRCISINLCELTEQTTETSTTLSALIHGVAIPKDRDETAMTNGIPATYVPARNTIFLSYAVALAEMIASSDLFIGVNAIDYSGYPDCRPQFIRAYETMANLATRASVEGHRLRLHTPLIDWPKVQIIQRGLELGVDFSLTHSCYDPNAAGRPCTRCDACLLRQRAFKQLGSKDPLLCQ